jgi:hypothetical protein
VLGPLAISYLWKGTPWSKSVKIAYSAVIFISWMLTFSAAGFAFLIFSLAFAFSYYLITGQFYKYFIYYKKIIIFMMVPIISFFIYLNYVGILDPIFNKIFLIGDSGSAFSRVSRWKVGLTDFSTSPFYGNGSGYYSAQGINSVISWYLLLLVEGGLLVLLPLLIFLVLVLARICRYRSKFQFAYMVGFVAGISHLSVISTFFIPALWLLLVIFYLDYSMKRS